MNLMNTDNITSIRNSVDATFSEIMNFTSQFKYKNDNWGIDDNGKLSALYIKDNCFFNHIVITIEDVLATAENRILKTTITYYPITNGKFTISIKDCSAEIIDNILSAFYADDSTADSVIEMMLTCARTHAISRITNVNASVDNLYYDSFSID